MSVQQETKNNQRITADRLVADPDTQLVALLTQLTDKAQRESFVQRYAALKQVKNALDIDAKAAIAVATQSEESALDVPSQGTENPEKESKLSYRYEVGLLAAVLFLIVKVVDNPETFTFAEIIYLFGFFETGLLLGSYLERFSKLTATMRAGLAGNTSLRGSFEALPNTSITSGVISAQEAELLAEIRAAVLAAQSAQE